MRPGNIVTWAGHIRMPGLDKSNIGIVLEFKDCYHLSIRWVDGDTSVLGINYAKKYFKVIA